MASRNNDYLRAGTEFSAIQIRVVTEEVIRLGLLNERIPRIQLSAKLEVLAKNETLQ